MFTLTISLDSLAVYIVAADIVLLLAYVLYILNRKRQLDRSIKYITEFVEEYFANTGIRVFVSCFKLDGDKRFVALIQSDPLKRFRFSSILERNLISHIYELTGNSVEKIYWRFPLQLNKETIAVTEEDTLDNDDLYLSDAYSTAQAMREYKVSEVPWDQFEEQKKSE